MRSTFNVSITGRVAKVLVTDPKTNQKVFADDKTPQLMQYTDFSHAVDDARNLRGLLQTSPNAQVEIRPRSLSDDQDGEKISLDQWIEVCAKVGAVQKGVDPTPDEVQQFIQAVGGSGSGQQTQPEPPPVIAK